MQELISLLHDLFSVWRCSCSSFRMVAVLFFYLHNPSDFRGMHPISYFASLPQTRAVFGMCLSFAAVCFWIFAKWQLSKHFVTPVRLFTFSMLAYLGMALFPFDPTNQFSDIVHTLLAVLFSVSFVVGIYVMALKNADKKLRLFSLPVLIFSSIVYLVLIFIKKNSFLFSVEIGVGVACQLWILAVSYRTYKVRKAKLLS